MKDKPFNVKETWDKVFSHFEVGQKVTVREDKKGRGYYYDHWKNWVGTLIAMTKSPNGWVYWGVLFKAKDNPKQEKRRDDMITIREKYLDVY